MSLPRTPDNFPRMKHRAAKRTGYSRPRWSGLVNGAPMVIDDGPTLRVFDADWNLVTSARTHSERRKLWRDLTVGGYIHWSHCGPQEVAGLAREIAHQDDLTIRVLWLPEVSS